MPVPFYNFKALHTQQFKAKVLERMDEIISQNSFIEGSYNQSFESRFATLQQAGRCLLVANGTDALEIALKAHNIGAGDKVGVPGITFYATSEAVINVGATPIFIDVCPNSGLIDIASTQRMLEQHKLKAIIPVHIYGLPAPIAALNKICGPLKVAIIEDAAQAQGGQYCEENLNGAIGSAGNLTTFSFYPTKNLGAFGDAGAILSPNTMLSDKIIAIRNHCRGKINELAHLGQNSRCDSFQAAVLDLKLDNIDEINQKRKDVAANYYQILLEGPLKLMPKSYLKAASWHLFPVLCASLAQKQKLQKHLGQHGIGNLDFYDQSQNQILSLRKYPGEWENAENFANKVICLPMNPFLELKDVQEVSEVLKLFFNA